MSVLFDILLILFNRVDLETHSACAGDCPCCARLLDKKPLLLLVWCWINIENAFKAPRTCYLSVSIIKSIGSHPVTPPITARMERLMSRVAPCCASSPNRTLELFFPRGPA